MGFFIIGFVYIFPNPIKLQGNQPYLYADVYNSNLEIVFFGLEYKLDRIYRKDIDLFEDDKYGHWWIKLDQKRTMVGGPLIELNL